MEALLSIVWENNLLGKDYIQHVYPSHVKIHLHRLNSTLAHILRREGTVLHLFSYMDVYTPKGI